MNRLVALFLLLVGFLPAGAEGFSGTLPVIYINTEDTIATKTDYVKGTYYVDALYIPRFHNLGTSDNPLRLKIRGHGNWTWFNEAFVKKSYRIKLESETPLLGMNSDEDFVLLAHYDGLRSYFRNAAGFWLSRELGLEYTPAEEPCELVLNGEYMGMYFLTENVRVGKHRVDVKYQLPGEKNMDKITGGWLIELDNAEDDNQLQMPIEGTDLEWLWVTYHMPEKLSTEQRDYLYNQIEEIKKRIYVTDKSSTEWEEMIDLNVLARFYMVHEVLDNLEGFLGSCYLYKDYGETKWKFGPVWDLGHAFNDWHPKDQFIYDYEGWDTSILDEIAKFPRFQEQVKKVWNRFYPTIYFRLIDYLNDYADYISGGARQDSQRWHSTRRADSHKVLADCLALLNEKIDFLFSQWGYGIESNDLVLGEKIYDLNGHQLSKYPRDRIYINGNKKYIK